MNTATRSQLRAQYNRAKKLGWIEHFREASNSTTAGFFDTADLMGIGSRETNLDPKWITKKGDHGHGAGLMQIDDRSFPAFTNSTAWKDARLGIMYGAKVLMQKWNDMENGFGKRLTVRSSRGKTATYTGKQAAGAIAQAIAISSYNCGRWAQYAYSRGVSIDAYTTGKDYSRDVVARAAAFRDMLGADGLLDRRVAPTGPDDPHAAPRPEDTVEPVEPFVAAGDPVLAELDPPEEVIVDGVVAGTADVAGASTLAGEVAAATPGAQIADTIVNTGDAAQPAAIENVTEEAPAKDGSTKTSTRLTVFGFAVPAALVGIVTAIQDAVSNGTINVMDALGAMFNFVTSNARYVFGLVGLVIVLQIVKKIFKQLGFLLQVLTKALPTWNNVTIVPSTDVAPEPEYKWWAFWR